MWESLVWTLVVMALVATVVFYGWGYVSPYIPEPFKMVIVVIGVVVMCLWVIALLTSRVALIPCCVIGGVNLL